MDEQLAETLYLSSVTVAELMFGVGTLPSGKRKDALNVAMNRLLSLFKGRVLPFDTSAAQHYAQLAINARTADEGISRPDGYIAAIAQSRGFAVATRDVSAFDAAGVSVINPWCA